MALFSTRSTSEIGFTAGELIRNAAARSVGIEPANASLQLLQTPLFKGQLLVHDVQEGLTLTASDVTYLVDQEISVHMDSCLVCGVLLKGAEEGVTVGDYGAVFKKFEQAVLYGFREKARCTRLCTPQQSSRTVGFVLKPVFFERFKDVVADDGIETLKKLLNRDFITETLARSSRILEIARRCFDHPYNGRLACLFLESNTLALLIEIADQLQRKGKIVSRIGRRSYERIMSALEIINADIVNPPSTMEIARKVGINVTDLRASFKSVTGTTIFEYVRNQRLQMAQVLLREHRIGIAEAGYRVGFSRPAAFTASYKRHFGHLPSQDATRD